MTYLFFESSQIQFYLRHIPLSFITIIKIKERNFRKDLQSWGSQVQVPSPPVYFLKHPCKQFSSHLDITLIKLETCYIFSRFNVIISNPAIF